MAKIIQLIKKEENLIKEKLKEKDHKKVLAIIKTQTKIEKEEIKIDPFLADIASKRKHLFDEQVNLLRKGDIAKAKEKIKEEFELLKKIEQYEKKKAKGKVGKIPRTGPQLLKPVLVAVFVLFIAFFLLKPGDLFAGEKASIEGTWELVKDYYGLMDKERNFQFQAWVNEEQKLILFELKTYFGGTGHFYSRNGKLIGYIGTDNKIHVGEPQLGWNPKILEKYGKDVGPIKSKYGDEDKSGTSGYKYRNYASP